MNADLPYRIDKPILACSIAQTADLLSLPIMKHFKAVVMSLLAAECVTAHYIFQQLSVGGSKYPVFEYIRKNSNYNSPVTDLASNDLRCNVGANGATTSTTTVQAGSSFTFTLDTPVYHQGPVSLYMSKAPGSAKDYDGSGNWFKIKDWGKHLLSITNIPLGPVYLLDEPLSFGLLPFSTDIPIEQKTDTRMVTSQAPPSVATRLRGRWRARTPSTCLPASPTASIYYVSSRWVSTTPGPQESRSFTFPVRKSR